MQTINAQTVEALKADGLYFEAGVLARAIGTGPDYGCHYGMRSTRNAAIATFNLGYNAVDTLRSIG